MKKHYFLWSMLAFLMATMLSVGIVACGDDDNGNGSSNAVTGTWVGQGYGEDDDEKVTIVFRGDLTGTFTISYYDSYYGTETETATFTYTLNEDNTGVMLFKFDKGDSYSSKGSGSSSGSGSSVETFYFWFDGDKLCIDDGRLYGTPEWVLTRK